MSSSVSTQELQQPGRHRANTPGNPLTRFVAGFIAALLVCTALVAAAVTPAHALTQGVSASLTINGSSYNGVKIVQPGQTLELKVQYDKTVTPGSTVAIELPENVTLSSVPAANTAVTSVERDPANPNRVLLTFADPFPASVDQGVLGLKFTVNKVDKSELTDITWNVDGDPQSVKVIVKLPNDPTQPTNTAQSKSIVGNANWNQYVSVVDGKVVVDSKILNNKVQYRLIVDHPNGLPGYSIADQLPAGMKYVDGSFRGVSNQWDDNGLNKVVTNTTFAPTISGNSFSTTIDLPAHGTSEFYYAAAIDGEAGVAALRDALQAAYDKIDPVKGGSYSKTLTNTATFGGTVKKSQSFTINGSVKGEAGVDLNQAFDKSATPDWQLVQRNADGTLVEPAQITYALKADLRQWDGTSSLRHPLAQNVVISDPLPSQGSWNVDDADFITATGMTIEQTDTIPTSAAAFAGDDFVGTWWVDGNTLRINVGMDNTTNASFKVKASVNTTTGLGNSTAWDHEAAYDAKLAFNNSATYEYEGITTRQSAGVTLQAQDKRDEGVNLPSSFKKTANPSQVTVKPGETTTVKYSFVVEPEAGVDLTKSSIVDYVDENIFNINDLDAVKAGLTASYNWQAMKPEDFVLAMNADDNLVITLSDSGKAVVAAAGANKHFELVLPLTTKPIVGTKTLDIVNRAVLFGADQEPLFWSEVSSEATSFGDEAQVRKGVWEAASKKFTRNLRASVAADGTLDQDTYVYRVAFTPHGNYNNVSIVDVVDQLPAGLIFLGFVNDDAVETANNPNKAKRSIGGNLEASYAEPSADAPAGTVTISQKSGTVLPAGTGTLYVNFAVKIDKFTVDSPIANVIGGASATIVPSDGFPLTIAKKDTTNAAKVIDDPSARFEILDETGAVVVSDVFVEKGFLMVADADGNSRAVKVPGAGTYKIRELKAPAGYELATEESEVRVAEDGSSPLIEFYNEPTPVVPTTPPTTTEPTESTDPTPTTTEPTESTDPTDEPTVDPSTSTTAPEPSGTVSPTSETATDEPTESTSSSSTDDGIEVGGVTTSQSTDGDNAAADGTSNSSAGAENELANTGVPATVPLVALAAALLALLGGVLMARGRVQRRH